MPQPQAPWAVQVSARIASHAVQAAPPVPQAESVGGVTQVPPVQHPVAQFTLVQLLHVPLVQVSPLGQLWQVAPPLPHEVAASPVSQVAPLQQPVHDWLLQTHCPLTHCCPDTHAAPVPQAQAPFAQLSASCASHVTHAAPPVPQESGLAT